MVKDTTYGLKEGDLFKTSKHRIVEYTGKSISATSKVILFNFRVVLYPDKVTYGRNGGPNRYFTMNLSADTEYIGFKRWKKLE